MSTKKPEPKKPPVTAKERIEAQGTSLKATFADSTDAALREISRENPAVDLAHRVMEAVGTQTAKVGARLAEPIVIETGSWHCEVCGGLTNLLTCPTDGFAAPGAKPNA